MRLAYSITLPSTHGASSILTDRQYVFLPPEQLKRHVGVEVMKQLINSFIFSRLDYCNALLIGLPFSTIAPLQRVQNAVARLLRELSRRDHVRPALKELHWLPVMYSESNCWPDWPNKAGKPYWPNKFRGKGWSLGVLEMGHLRW